MASEAALADGGGQQVLAGVGQGLGRNNSRSRDQPEQGTTGGQDYVEQGTTTGRQDYTDQSGVVGHDEDAPDALQSEYGMREVVLAAAIQGLAERDRTIVGLYYFENLTLAEIGKVLGVTESRVCQLHTRAVLRLRARLAEAHGD